MEKDVNISNDCAEADSAINNGEWNRYYAFDLETFVFLDLSESTLSKLLESLEGLGVLSSKNQDDVKLAADQAQRYLHGADMATENNISSLNLKEDGVSTSRSSKDHRRKLRRRQKKKKKNKSGGVDFILEEDKEM